MCLILKEPRFARSKITYKNVTTNCAFSSIISLLTCREHYTEDNQKCKFSKPFSKTKIPRASGARAHTKNKCYNTSMLNHCIAAKGFIINQTGELLCIKRRPNDVQTPDSWDIPGGRLNEGESPFTGLWRECKEEVGLDIDVTNPLGIHHFTRQDGQLITMISFLCHPTNKEQQVVLSEEHTEHKWLTPKEARKIIHEAFHKEIDAFQGHFV